MFSRLRPHDGPEVRTPIQSLDIQYTVGLASNVPVTFVSVGGNNEDIDEVNFLLQQDDLPLVLTTSFGHNEFDEPSFGPFAEYVHCASHAPWEYTEHACV